MRKILRRTKARLKASLETGLAGTFYWDIPRDLIIADENITHYFSLPEAAITEGTSIREVLPAIFEGDRTRVLRSLTVAIKNAVGYREEFRIRLPGGDIRWISARCTIRRDADDLAIGLSGLVMDITERKMAEEALQQSEENYRVIVNQSIAGILKVDFSGSIIFSNERFGKMLGYRVPQLLELTVTDIIYEADIDRNAVLFERLVNEGEAYEIEKRLLCSDGTVIWVNNQISPIFDPQGKPHSAVIISVDITRQKAVEKQKDEFIGMASHELKTPLTGIKAYGQLLNREFRHIDERQSAGLIMKLNGQIDRMVKLVYALLDTTMISGGELGLQKETFDLNMLVEEQLKEARITGPTHHFSHQPCSRPAISADRERIGQVLTNLIGNAIKYSAEGSEVSIRCEDGEHRIKVSVRDDGIGLSADMQEKVFDRFFRVGAAAPAQGFGLGLYIAAEIIKKHDGEIGVNSIPGNGSVFYFTLPV